MESLFTHPWDPFTTYDNDTCPNGVFKASTSTCASNINYPVPSAGRAAFYTTWSFYTCMISVVLFIVYLLMVLVGKGKHQARFRTKVLNNKVFQLIMIGLIAMPALNSVGVLSTSQLLLSKNFKLINEDKKQVVSKDDMKNYALSTTFFNNAMNINLDSHIIPGLLGFCVLLGLSLTRHDARPWKWNFGIACFIILLNLLLASIWMSVPVYDEKEKKSYVWIEKIKYVYANPTAWFFILQFSVVIILALVVSFRVA